MRDVDGIVLVIYGLAGGHGAGGWSDWYKQGSKLHGLAGWVLLQLQLQRRIVFQFVRVVLVDNKRLDKGLLLGQGISQHGQCRFMIAVKLVFPKLDLTVEIVNGSIVLHLLMASPDATLLIDLHLFLELDDFLLLPLQLDSLLFHTKPELVLVGFLFSLWQLLVLVLVVSGRGNQRHVLLAHDVVGFLLALGFMTDSNSHLGRVCTGLLCMMVLGRFVVASMLLEWTLILLVMGRVRVLVVLAGAATSLRRGRASLGSSSLTACSLSTLPSKPLFDLIRTRLGVLAVLDGR